MDAQEFKEAQKTANEIAFLLVELKKEIQISLKN